MTDTTKKGGQKVGVVFGGSVLIGGTIVNFYKQRRPGLVEMFAPSSGRLEDSLYLLQFRSHPAARPKSGRRQPDAADRPVEQLREIETHGREDPGSYGQDRGTRLLLYQAFHRLWQSRPQDTGFFSGCSLRSPTSQCRCFLPRRVASTPTRTPGKFRIWSTT